MPGFVFTHFVDGVVDRVVSERLGPFGDIQLGLTGAGFGGCAIALVKEQAIPEFSRQLIAYYEARVGYPPEVIVSEIGEGVNLII